MLNNLVNEVIILIASIMSLIVVLHAEQELESFFSIKQGIAFMVLADVIIFILSASPVGINLLIIVLCVLAVKFSKLQLAHDTFSVAVCSAWLIQLVRLISRAAGFKATIPYLASLISAAAITAFVIFLSPYWRKKNDTESDETDVEDDSADDADEPIKKGFFASHPVAVFTAGFGTIAVVIFAIAVIFV